MIINTQLCVAHKELITIFLKANNLVGIVIREYPLEIRGRFHMVLQLESTYEPSAEALTFLGFRHSGVLNMFDDYLLKCGVEPDALQPKSYYRQLQEEREQEITEKFIKQFKIGGIC
jgi:hypothetical protein